MPAGPSPGRPSSRSRLIAAACGSGDDGGTIEGPTITIGSANFSENALVAEIYAQALESEGYQVERKLNIGSREIYAPALEAGELDLIPEYIGTMLTYLGGTPSPDSAETHAALQEAWESKGIEVLDFAPAQDKNGFVVTRATAEALALADGLRSRGAQWNARPRWTTRVPGA